jgi:hypothetical protein
MHINFADVDNIIKKAARHRWYEVMICAWPSNETKNFK